MAILRQDTDYAMRALVSLALAGKGECVSVPKISGTTGVPLPYAHKIVRKLRDAGIVTCHRGTRGGVKLNLASKRIRLIDVIDAIQGNVAFSQCLIGKNICSRQKSCRISRKLAKLQDQMVEMLEKTTLAHVLAEVNGKPRKKGKGGRR